MMIQYLEIKANADIFTTETKADLLELWLDNGDRKIPIYVKVKSVTPQSGNQAQVILQLQPQFGGDIVPLSQLNVGTLLTLSNDFRKQELGKAEAVRRWFEPAPQSAWKVTPFPDDTKTVLDYERSFSDNEYNRIILGEIPSSMEDKWFCYFENGWLYWHRSWTGIGVFEVHIEQVSNIFKVTKAFLNPDTLKENSPLSTTPAEMLDSLIDNMCREAMQLFDE